MGLQVYSVDMSRIKTEVEDMKWPMMTIVDNESCEACGAAREEVSEGIVYKFSGGDDILQEVYVCADCAKIMSEETMKMLDGKMPFDEYQKLVYEVRRQHGLIRSRRKVNADKLVGKESEDNA